MVAQVKIEAEVRESNELGKGPSRRLRQQGMIPANLIEKGKSTSLKLRSKLIEKAWANNREFDLVLSGTEKKVRIVELQLDPVKRAPLHIDVIPV